MDIDVGIWLETDGVEFFKSIGMKEGQRVLDFGCGEGHYSVPAAKLIGEKGKLYAIDKDRQVLDRLADIKEKNKLGNIEVMQTESNISLKKNSIDFILCYDVIHYIKQRSTLYHEFHNVLKQNGVFSLYPKHNKDDYPLMELAHLKLESIIGEVEEEGFSLQDKLFKRLIHDDNYNDGYILNFGKRC